jgi:hypothetical protein
MPGADDDMREPPAKRQAVGATPEAAPVAETPGESGRGTRRRAREQPVATSEKQHGGEQNSPSNVGAGPADVAAASGGPGANAAAGSAAGAATGASAGATGAVPGAAPGMQRAEAASAPAEAPAAAKRAAAAASARDPASAGGTAPEAPGPAAGGASDAAAGDGTPRVGENAGGAAGGAGGAGPEAERRQKGADWLTEEEKELVAQVRRPSALGLAETPRPLPPPATALTRARAAARATHLRDRRGVSDRCERRRRRSKRPPPPAGGGGGGDRRAATHLAGPAPHPAERRGAAVERGGHPCVAQRVPPRGAHA